MTSQNRDCFNPHREQVVRMCLKEGEHRRICVAYLGEEGGVADLGQASVLFLAGKA